MNISSKGQYALAAIFDLACQKPDEQVKTATIAKRQKIPRKYLELILISLKQGGFVTSRRGSDGGYSLAGPAESITVGDVLRFIDGVGLKKPNRNHPPSPFSAVWGTVDQAVAEILDRQSFASIVRDWVESQQSHALDWQI